MFKKIIKRSIRDGSRTHLGAIGENVMSLYRNGKALLFHIKNYYAIPHKKLTKKRIHFGCGADYKEGFINIDMNKTADFYFDARDKLPFEDGTIEYMYSSHFIEHITNSELMRHFQDCFELLQTGGIYRICAPDFVSAVQAYVKKDQGWLETCKQRPIKHSILPDHLLSYADYLDRVLHEHNTHKVFFDYEKIRNMLIHAGFHEQNICLVEYDPAIDLSKRRGSSIYIEAVK